MRTILNILGTWANIYWQHWSGCHRFNHTKQREHALFVSTHNNKKTKTHVCQTFPKSLRVSFRQQETNMGPSKTSLVYLCLPRKSRNWLAPHETNHAIFLVVQSVGGLVVCWVLLSYQWLKSVVYLLLTFTLLTLSLKYVGQTDGHCIHLWMCSDRRHVCQQHLHIKSSTDKRIILLFLLASIFTVYVFFSFFVFL